MVPDRPFRDREYFLWLCERVRIPPGLGTYNDLLDAMFKREFVWVVGNDENRISDGRNLRYEYNDDRGFSHRVDREPVSFLEVLIGIAEHVGFLVDQDATYWSWILIRNIGLAGFHDPLSGKEHRKVMAVLERVIFRSYDPNGSGGFFPLANPKSDQRQVEIWYQMSAYIEENKVSFGL